MAMMIKGIRIDSISISRKDSGEGVDFSGRFALMGANDNVLAKQDYSNSSYNPDVKLEMSPTVTRLFRELSAAVKADIENMLGISDEIPAVK